MRQPIVGQLIVPKVRTPWYLEYTRTFRSGYHTHGPSINNAGFPGQTGPPGPYRLASNALLFSNHTLSRRPGSTWSLPAE